MEEILRRLGRRIREIRIERGFKSQEEFADYCKLHRTFVGHLETGRKDFRLTTVIRVAEALGVTLEELFAGLDTGKAFKARRGKPSPVPDLAGLSRELAALERSLVRLKQIVLPPNEPTGRQQPRVRRTHPKKTGRA